MVQRTRKVLDFVKHHCSNTIKGIDTFGQQVVTLTPNEELVPGRTISHIGFFLPVVILKVDIH
jgi:hypothetical protein